MTIQPVVLITGALTGIGRATAFAFARDKASMLATVPLKRAGTPEELADAIVFVASEKASFMTGEILRANGGRTAA